MFYFYFVFPPFHNIWLCCFCLCIINFSLSGLCYLCSKLCSTSVWLPDTDTFCLEQQSKYGWYDEAHRGSLIFVSQYSLYFQTYLPQNSKLYLAYNMVIFLNVILIFFQLYQIQAFYVYLILSLAMKIIQTINQVLMLSC